MHTSVMVNLAQCPNVRNLVSKSNRIGYSGLPRILFPPLPPEIGTSLQDLETLVQNKPPLPRTHPKLEILMADLENFDPEYPIPPPDWTFLWWTLCHGLVCGEFRWIPLGYRLVVLVTHVTALYTIGKRENQDQFSQSCP